MELGLNGVVASRIVKKIMGILNYNINIMNEFGHIIASGDESRIGQIHKGAVEAIRLGTIREIFEDTETEKKGINKPIVIDKKIHGVIGISGDPKEVRKFAELITITAQLMVEQQMYLNIEEVKQTRFRDFLNEWIYLENNLFSDDFKLRAEILEIDISMERVIVLLKMDKLRYNLYDSYLRFLNKNEYVMRYGIQNILLILDAKSDISDRVRQIADYDENISYATIGDKDFVLKKSLQQADRLSTLFAKGIVFEKIAKYVDYEMIDAVLISNAKYRLSSYIQKLNDTDKTDNLYLTLKTYIEQNGDIKIISEQLFIHRNTLTYRLNKIQEITGLSFKNYKDLTTMYLAVISYQYCNKEI